MPGKFNVVVLKFWQDKEKCA